MAEEQKKMVPTLGLTGVWHGPRRLGECLLEGDLAAELAPMRAGEVSHLVQQHIAQDLPQPARELGLGAAAKLGEAADGLEQRLLDDVRRVKLGPESRLDLKPRGRPEPASIPLKHGNGKRIAAGVVFRMGHGVLSG